jgi:hypothetical protein
VHANSQLASIIVVTNALPNYCVVKCLAIPGKRAEAAKLDEGDSPPAAQNEEHGLSGVWLPPLV